MLVTCDPGWPWGCGKGRWGGHPVLLPAGDPLPAQRGTGRPGAARRERKGPPTRRRVQRGREGTAAAPSGPAAELTRSPWGRRLPLKPREFGTVVVAEDGVGPRRLLHDAGVARGGPTRRGTGPRGSAWGGAVRIHGTRATQVSALRRQVSQGHAIRPPGAQRLGPSCLGWGPVASRGHRDAASQAERWDPARFAPDALHPGAGEGQ